MGLAGLRPRVPYRTREAAMRARSRTRAGMRGQAPGLWARAVLVCAVASVLACRHAAQDAPSATALNLPYARTLNVVDYVDGAWTRAAHPHPPSGHPVTALLAALPPSLRDRVVWSPALDWVALECAAEFATSERRLPLPVLQWLGWKAGSTALIQNCFGASYWATRNLHNRPPRDQLENLIATEGVAFLNAQLVARAPALGVAGRGRLLVGAARMRSGAFQLNQGMVVAEEHTDLAPLAKSVAPGAVVTLTGKMLDPPPGNRVTLVADQEDGSVHRQRSALSTDGAFRVSWTVPRVPGRYVAELSVNRRSDDSNVREYLVTLPFYVGQREPSEPWADLHWAIAPSGTPDSWPRDLGYQFNHARARVGSPPLTTSLLTEELAELLAGDNAEGSGKPTLDALLRQRRGTGPSYLWRRSSHAHASEFLWRLMMSPSERADILDPAFQHAAVAVHPNGERQHRFALMLSAPPPTLNVETLRTALLEYLDVSRRLAGQPATRALPEVDARVAALTDAFCQGPADRAEQDALAAALLAEALRAGVPAGRATARVKVDTAPTARRWLATMADLVEEPRSHLAFAACQGPLGDRPFARVTAVLLFDLPAEPGTPASVGPIFDPSAPTPY